MNLPNMSINISQARYAELLRAERDAVCLKSFIYSKFKEYGSVRYEELKMLYTLYFSEGETNDADS